MGNEYNPATHAPGTADEAQRCARSRILPGFAPLGDIRKVQLSPGQEDLMKFQDRTVVPAFLLYTDGELRNHTFEPLFYRVTTASGLNGDKHHPPTDIFFMMILSPDHKSWVQLPFIIEDLGKSTEELKQEILDIQHLPELTKAKRLIMGMKEAVYYAYTGSPMDLAGLIKDFYQVYTARPGL